MPYEGREPRFYVDPSPILLCEPILRRTPNGDPELYAVMEVAHLKSSRAKTMKKLAPRPDYFGLYVGNLDPSGPEGQRCRLQMRTVCQYGPRGGVPAPASKPGRRERDLCRLLQKVSLNRGETYLFGVIPSKRLTHLLRELAESAGGKLETVAVIIRRTLSRPEWIVFLAIP